MSRYDVHVYLRAQTEKRQWLSISSFYLQNIRVAHFATFQLLTPPRAFSHSFWLGDSGKCKKIPKSWRLGVAVFDLSLQYKRI